MIDNELSAKIRKCIEEVYCCKCTFKIDSKVISDENSQHPEIYTPKTYKALLYIHNYDIDPMHIIWEGDSEENFLKYLKEDLKHRELIRSSHINISLNHDI